MVSAGFEFEAEVTCMLLKCGYKIREVPIRYRPRSFSEGKKIRFRDGITGMRTIIRIWQSAGTRPKKVMVFGVFDGLHEGHHAFLRAAKTRGRELVVVVARDEVVRQLKNKTPRHNERERLAAIARADNSARAVLGDPVLGTYGVIKEHKPDIICLGYDQDALAKDLEEKMKSGVLSAIPLYHIASYRQDHMHISLLRE